MSIKAKIEAIIYAAEEPVTLDQIFALIKDEVRQELASGRTGEPVNGRSEVDAMSSENPVPPTDTTLPDSDTEMASAPQVSDNPTAPPSDPQFASPPVRPLPDAEVKAAVRAGLEELVADYASPEHGIEVRQIAGGYRMATKPEQHDLVRAFAKGLKPPIRLSLPALETLAVIAYKQPITAPEISDIRGVDTGGVLGTLLERKLITTAGRKQVVGRPILYKTTREFLLRFGLKDLEEMPSMEEFEKLAAESLGADLFAPATPPAQPESSSPQPQSNAADDGAQEAEAEKEL